MEKFKAILAIKNNKLPRDGSAWRTHKKLAQPWPHDSIFTQRDIFTHAIVKRFDTIFTRFDAVIMHLKKSKFKVFQG